MGVLLCFGLDLDRQLIIPVELLHQRPYPQTEAEQDAVGAPQLEPTRWVYVSAGGNHTCAIAAGSKLACWGREAEGQTRVPEGMGLNIVTVAGGMDFTCAIKNSHSQYDAYDDAHKFLCWGATIQ